MNDVNDSLRAELKMLTERIVRMVCDVRSSGPTRSELERREYLRKTIGKTLDFLLSSPIFPLSNDTRSPLLTAGFRRIEA
jgi:hypothetical protein